MAIHGLVLREFPKAQFLRGWYPQTPNTRTNSLKVDGAVIPQGALMSLSADGTAWVLGVPASDADTGIVAFAQNDSWQDDVKDINQLVGLNCSGQFRIATPYFKRYANPTHSNGVVSAPGALCVYANGTPVTWCTNDEVDCLDEVSYVGNTQTLVRHAVSAAGYIRPAAAGEAVIGYVTQQGAGRYTTIEMSNVAKAAASNPTSPAAWITGLNRDYAGYNKGQGSRAVDMPAGAMPLQFSIGSAQSSSSPTNTAYYVVIDTTYVPAAPTPQGD